MLISIFGAMLASHLFELWLPDQVAEAWAEFSDTKFPSWKKALYYELMLQMTLYFFLTIYMVDWSLLLVIIAGYYLDAKVKNFKIMYIVLVSISIVFDIFRFAALPDFANMTPGESFGNTLWTFIFLLKPLIVGTIFMYEKEGLDAEGGESYAKMEDPSRGDDNDEIAE